MCEGWCKGNEKNVNGIIKVDMTENWRNYVLR